ncbi:MAG: GNAT family N-acetyltransferase [Caldilineaceae bacterium]|nr:GNAT family N-acetyltransferase [Caldilineaceae bacterium]
MQPIVETARLYARHFAPADLDQFAALCADAQVLRYVGDGTTLTRDEVAHWIAICQQKYANRGYGTSAVFEKATERFIGYCGVVRAPGNDFDELIYVYHVDTWGKGYATEMGRAMLAYVFANSPLDAIYATIDAENQPSQRVARKLGMRFEKRLFEEDVDKAVDYYVIRRSEDSME